MSYEVELTSADSRQIMKLPRNYRERTLDAIESLSLDPRPNGSRKLVGEATA